MKIEFSLKRNIQVDDSHIDRRQTRHRARARIREREREGESFVVVRLVTLAHNIR